MSVYSEEMMSESSDFSQDEDQDKSDEDVAAKIPSFVKQDSRVYIYHDFAGSRELNAHWQGQWHLAYVEEVLNDEGAIRLLWAR